MDNSMENHNSAVSTQIAGSTISYRDGAIRKRVLSISSSAEPEAPILKKRPRVAPVSTQLMSETRAETRLNPSTVRLHPQSGACLNL